MRARNIGIVGCGSAGGASALFFARAGHAVTLYERVPEPGPVGAGIVLQPTGMFVLARLGLLEQVLARGARIERLYCQNAKKRTVVDLSYARGVRGTFGLGLHRGVLFHALFAAAKKEPNISLRLGCDIKSFREDAAGVHLVDGENQAHGPHELLIIADGAQSSLRKLSQLETRASKYPWGALWFVARDPQAIYHDVLFQVVDGPSRLLGLLPTGVGPDENATTPLVSIFWSMRGDRVDAWRRSGFEQWKGEIEKYDPRSRPLLAQIDGPEQVLYSSYYDVVLKRAHTGSVIYLGDAAHAMSPQLGQGCNLALYDAMTLADCVAELEAIDTIDATGEKRPITPALVAYGRRRKHHLAYYQFATRWLTPLFQSDDRMLGFIRDAAMGVLCKLWPFEQAMLYSMSGVKRGILRPSIQLEPGR